MATRKKTTKRKKTTRSKSTIVKAPKAPASKVEALANSIFNDREELENDFDGDSRDDFKKISKEIAEDNSPKEKVAFEFQETPIPVKKEEKDPTPIAFTIGLSPRNPITVRKSEKEVFWFLNESFGINDGSYFVHSDITETRMIQGQRKKFKTLHIEDGNGFKYILWFDLSPISLIHNTQYGTLNHQSLFS